MKLGQLEERIQELQVEVAGLKDRIRSTPHENKSPVSKVDSPGLSKTPLVLKESLKSDFVSCPLQPADTSGRSEQMKSHFMLLL